MNINFIGFLLFSFLGMTIVNRIMEGAFVTSSDMAVVNNLTIFRSMDVFGSFSVPILNMSFITQGLPSLVKFDYSYFSGIGGYVQYFLYSLTGMLAFGLFILMIGLSIYSFSRAR